MPCPHLMDLEDGNDDAVCERCRANQPVPIEVDDEPLLEELAQPAEPRELMEIVDEALRSPDAQGPLLQPPPAEELPRPEDAEMVAAPNAQNVLAPPPPAPPKAVQLKVLVWNMRNLGGAFGVPAERDEPLLQAAARILHAADADVITVLEVLQRGGFREKKPTRTAEADPGKVRNAEKSELLQELSEALGCRGKEHELLEELAPAFVQRVQAVLWPGAPAYGGDKGPLLGGHAALLQGAWDATCKAGIGKLAPPRVRPEGSFDMLRVKFTNRDTKAWRERVRIWFLREEGYKSWFDRARKQRGDDGEDVDEGMEPVASKDEGKKRNERAEEFLEHFAGEVQPFWFLFVRYLIDRRVAGKPKPYQQQLYWDLLTYSRDRADYEARVARWEKRKAEASSKGDSHTGIREFLVLRDLLNDLSDDAYASWPEREPAEDAKGVYTERETYGVLWKKARVKIDPSKVHYLGLKQAEDEEEDEEREEDEAGKSADKMVVEDDDEAKEVSFSKRRPLYVPLEIAGAPPLALVPWHAPAPSKDNAQARGKDFPAFMAWSEGEREAGRLTVLLSDLNVDTEKEKRKSDDEKMVSDCVPELSEAEFFAGVSGEPVGAMLSEHQRQYTTLGESTNTLRPWLAEFVLQGTVTTKGKEEAESLEKWIGDRLPAERRRLAIKSPRDLVGYVQSFLEPPSQRFGASGYDKILAVCGATRRPSDEQPWRLRFLARYAVPFPHALLYEDELTDLVLVPESAYPTRLGPWLRLLERDVPGGASLLERLRPKAERKAGSRGARLISLMARAKDISDHLPVVAHLELTEAPEGKEDTATQVASTAARRKYAISRALDQRCARFESSREEEREGTLEELLDWWGTQKELHQSAAARERLQGALEHHTLLRMERAPERVERFQKRSTTAIKGTKVDVVGEYARVLAGRGLSVIGNGGGGDCLFRALSQLVYGTERFHLRVRRAVVHHLSRLLAGEQLDAEGRVGGDTHAEFCQHMRELLAWHREAWPHAAAYRRADGIDEWTQYLRAMRRAEVWGDLIALSAASHLFGVHFRVHAVLAGGGVWNDEVNFVDRAVPAPLPQFDLLNSGNAHFELILPDAQPRGEPLVVPARDLEEQAAAGLHPSRLPPGERREGEGGPAPEESARPASRARVHAAVAPHGKVFRWPDRPFWTLRDARAHPECLFLFGENSTDKGSRKEQKTTQAVIRPADNALGIRTCTAPGVGMRDEQLEGTNDKLIDADFAEARRALESGRYSTLVVPWNHARGETTLGRGEANLGPHTYDYVAQKLQELIDWAAAHLQRRVQVVTRRTALTRLAARKQAGTLFLVERAEVMGDAPMDEASSASPLGQENVVSLVTHQLPGARSPEEGLFTDAQYAESVVRIDQALRQVEEKLRTGTFARLALPVDDRGQLALGTLGDLANVAPRTWAYLTGRIEALGPEWMKLPVDDPEVEDASMAPSPARSGPEPLERKRSRTAWTGEGKKDGEDELPPVAEAEAEENPPPDGEEHQVLKRRKDKHPPPPAPPGDGAPPPGNNASMEQ